MNNLPIDNKATGFGFRCCGYPGISLVEFLGLLTRKNNVFSFLRELNATLTHKCRTSIKACCDLIGDEKRREILVPSYNCGSEIDVFFSLDYDVVCYKVDKYCKIDIEDMKRKINPETCAIYVIHYFGFFDEIEKIRQICDKNKIYLIEDCALALFSKRGDRNAGTWGDFSFFSLPKSLPVPDGGALVINDKKLSKTCKRFTEAPRYAPVLKNMLVLLKNGFIKILHQVPFLRYLLYNMMSQRQKRRNSRQKGTTGPDLLLMPSRMYYKSKYYDNRRISFFTMNIGKSIDYHQIVKSRRDNFELISNELESITDIEPLFKKIPEGVCPLYYPIIVPNRHKVYTYMSERLVEPCEWWAGHHPKINWAEYADASHLKNNLLILPIDHRIGKKEIVYMVGVLHDAIQNAKKELPNESMPLNNRNVK